MNGLYRGLLVSALAIATPQAAAADIVRWVDENGVVHFTDRYKVPAQHRDSAAPVNVRSSAGSAPDKATVSLQMRGQVAVVQVMLNNSAAANLVVDTGSSATVISHATARQLGIDVEGTDLPRVSFNTANGVVSAPVVTLDSVEVGGMEVRGLMASVHDIAPGISGLLGLNYLGHFRMDIDSRTGLMHLERK